MSTFSEDLARVREITARRVELLNKPYTSREVTALFVECQAIKEKYGKDSFKTKFITAVSDSIWG
jgi:hypothetical protein